MCPFSFSVLCVSRHPLPQGSLTEVDRSQAVKSSTDATVRQQLNYCDTSRNQQGCREHQHMFSTEGHEITVNAQYSIQVTAITPNV